MPASTVCQRRVETPLDTYATSKYIEQLNSKSNRELDSTQKKANINMCVQDALGVVQICQSDDCSTEKIWTPIATNTSSQESSRQGSEEDTAIVSTAGKIARVSRENESQNTDCEYSENKNGCQDKYFKIPRRSTGSSTFSPPILYGNRKQITQSGHGHHFKEQKRLRTSTRLGKYCSCDSPGNYLGSIVLDPTSYRFPTSSPSLYEARIAANGVTLYCNKTETFYDDIFEFLFNARKSELERVTAKIKHYDYYVENKNETESDSKTHERNEEYLQDKQSMDGFDYYFAEREDDILDPYENRFDPGSE